MSHMNNLRANQKKITEPLVSQDKSHMRVLIESSVQDYLSTLNIHNLFGMIEEQQKQIVELSKKIDEINSQEKKEEFIVNPDLTSLVDEIDFLKDHVEKLQEGHELLTEFVKNIQVRQNVFRKKGEDEKK